MVDTAPADASPKPTAPSSRRTIPWRRKIAFTALIWLVLFGVPELMVRLLWKPAPPRTPAVGTRQFVNWLSHLSEDERNPQPLYLPDSRLLWRLQPGARITSFNHHFAPDGEKQPIRITINGDGYRGQLIRAEDRTEDTAVSRVLCLGDSNFFGYPLDDQETFPSVLGRTLQQNCPGRHWEVINGGVPGYTVVQGQLWYQMAFQGHRFDLLLLSFLNNDAWRQPGHDSDLLARTQSPWQPLGDLARQSRLVAWAESVLRPAVPKNRYVPRVPLDEFVARYRQLIDAAHHAGTRVVILDYRAYDQYAPYSQSLRGLAAEMQVEYIPVQERVAAVLADPAVRSRYPSQAARIELRWGAELLQERPYLWFFAEFHPEHLNELGVAWLADQLHQTLCREPE